MAALLLPVAALLLAWMLSGACRAEGFGADFAADIVQTGPDGAVVHGRMVVGAGRVRSEFEAGGQRIVEIHLPREKVSYTVLPERGLYRQRTLELPEAVENDSMGNPCRSNPGWRCLDEGLEQVNGRVTRRWTVTAGDSPTRQGTIWTDERHGFPVKEAVDGVVVSELTFRGSEILAGRATEKWEARQRGRDGGIHASVQWYDPALNIAIRQELPGGYVRELRDIRVAAQPDHLFAVPAGFRPGEGSAFGR